MASSLAVLLGVRNFRGQSLPSPNRKRELQVAAKTSDFRTASSWGTVVRALRQLVRKFPTGWGGMGLETH